jgi:hypothetical protein
MRTAVCCAALALLIAAVGQATTCRADYVTFTYSDTAGDQAHGWLMTDSTSFDSAGGQHVTSGMLDVTASVNANQAVGTYTLLPIGPNESVSPSGQLFADNLIYSVNNAADGFNPGPIGNNPSYLTGWGLLFGQPGTGSQTEVNIFGSSTAATGPSGNYAFYTVAGGNLNIQTGSGGTFSPIFVTPEPSSLLLAGVAAMLAVGYGLKRRGRR